MRLLPHRRSPEERAQPLAAQAAKFERLADDLAENLPAQLLASPPVSDDVAKRLAPDDPEWQRHAVDRLRASARDLREMAEQRRRAAD
jgi:hypothetical protein